MQYQLLRYRPVPLQPEEVLVTHYEVQMQTKARFWRKSVETPIIRVALSPYSSYAYWVNKENIPIFGLAGIILAYGKGGFDFTEGTLGDLPECHT